MQSYNKIRKQFEEFIEILKNQPSNSYLIRLINLILESFDDIASSGTASGKRAKLIYQLILSKGESISNKFIPAQEEKKKVDNAVLLRLVSLQVERFRGFTHRQNFDLQKQYILIYGTNGSGKSSFCEAIEYSLLGDIDEAHKKRINVAEYIKNADYGSFISPVLKGVNSDGELITVKSNYDQFHFSFIEKSRIDSFARLSSHTPGDQAGLIATLFGLEEFNSFVKEFTENIENYIPLENQKEKEYLTKSGQIENYKKNKLSYEGISETIGSKKVLIATESKITTDFKKLEEYINGNSETKGRLKEIQEELSKNQPEKVEFISIEVLFESIENIQLQLEEFKEIQSEYLRKINLVNLTILYNSLINIESLETTVCPACETPLKDTNKNPFTNAKEKLEELKSISQIQESRNLKWQSLVVSVRQILSNIKQLIEALKKAEVTIGVYIPKEIQVESPNIS
jgi:DNA sulfur modification protein DndD